MIWVMNFEKYYHKRSKYYHKYNKLFFYNSLHRGKKKLYKWTPSKTKIFNYFKSQRSINYSRVIKFLESGREVYENIQEDGSNLIHC